MSALCMPSGIHTVTEQYHLDQTFFNLLKIQFQ